MAFLFSFTTDFTFSAVLDIVGNWILATGFWNDTGEWEDTAVWTD